uniref:Ovule protein n=1 Tax=Ascaris lumbricoides TaxID=6252 RepID=A0A0M3ISU3_ASCLU
MEIKTHKLLKFSKPSLCCNNSPPQNATALDAIVTLAEPRKAESSACEVASTKVKSRKKRYVILSSLTKCALFCGPDFHD